MYHEINRDHLKALCIECSFLGTLDDFFQAIQGVILSNHKSSAFLIKVKNEFLGLLDDRGANIAQAPNRIALLSKDSLLPILSDQCSYMHDL